MSDQDESSQRLSEFLRKEHEIQRALAQVIKQHLIKMPEINAGEWLEGLRVAFQRLREHLTRSYTAKEADGYLKMVIELRPTLSKQVEAIRREHSEILHMAARILEDLSETRPDQYLLIADASARIQRFIAVVGQHEQKENMITLVVFSQDLSAED